MSHEIEVHGNKAAYVGARTTPWHMLGTTVEQDGLTAEQVLELGHLGGWDVRTVPALAAVGDGTLEIPGKFGVVRTNPFTGTTEALPATVGSKYTPIQNESMVEFLNALVDESGAVFDTAGSLKGGTEVFVTMKMPKGIQVGGQDRVDVNIAALNSHDGKSAKTILVTPVRVVCANTQRAALGNFKSKFTIRHTAGAGKNIQAAREALGLTFAYVEAFEAEAEKMIQTTMTEAKFNEIVGNLYGTLDKDAPERLREAHMLRTKTLHQLLAEADTNAGIRGTVWGGAQAVLEYEDHFAKVKNMKQADLARAQRALTPAVEAFKSRAFGAFHALVG